MSNFIGPALPPHLQKKLELNESNEEKKSDTCQSMIGPALPPDLHHEKDNASNSEKESKNIRSNQEPEIVGPSLSYHINKSSDTPSDVSVGPDLPSWLRKEQTVTTDPNLQSKTDLPLVKEVSDEDNSVLSLDTDISDEEKSKSEIYGPALPPHLRTVSSGSVMGPSLPPGIKLPDVSESSDSDADVVGPMPIPENCTNSAYIEDQFENRAMKMKRKLVGESDSQDSGPLKRESWMLELPPERAAEFGLGPRQFRTRAKPDSGDRSIWTDTPADRLRKIHCEKNEPNAVNETELQAIVERDKEMQHLVEKHSGKKKQDSLLESHQKELRKKRKKDKEDGKKEERRPFDRDIDLQANRFDDAQKKAIFKKAQMLNDRFSSGQSKFL